MKRVMLTLVLDVEDEEGFIEGAKARAEAQTGDAENIIDVAAAAVEYVELIDDEDRPLLGFGFTVLSIEAEIDRSAWAD